MKRERIIQPLIRTGYNRWPIVLLTLVLIFLPAAPAQAASLTVNSLADADNGSDGVCTLREAIIAANNNATYHECASSGFGIDTITFSVSGTITLGASLPNVADSAGLTINGGSGVTLSGNNAVRVFQVNSGAALTLQNLTVTQGKNDSSIGGGLYNNGTVTISNSTFSGNNAQFGGGLYNNGTATISYSTFSGNSADSGGGISNASSGVATINNSTFSGNSTTFGGGIFNSGTVSLSNSLVSANNASNSGGGLSNTSSGTVIISDSTLSGNSTISGGGIFNGGTVTINNSTFAGNSASNSGGGLSNSGGTVTTSNSTFSSNSANNFGGSINNVNGGTTTIRNGTFASNSATFGGGIYNFGGTVTLANTIVTTSPSGGNCSGTVTNGGHNLDSLTTCGWGSNNGSLSSTDPQLGPLANNGGLTQTHALLQGSPAVDRGNNSLLPLDSTDLDGDGNTTEPIPFDQRGSGHFRVAGGTVDIGAFERQRVYLPIVIK
ncbi:MAG TPA: choice-of-anchor Q domain-containing protein [Anaerolineae bacterium]|mgnify:CR=1 FL=1|nr:choice-of-anchor Q domain-containing protein [Anaerolineae bacterium]